MNQNHEIFHHIYEISYKKINFKFLFYSLKYYLHVYFKNKKITEFRKRIENVIAKYKIKKRNLNIYCLTIKLEIF